MSGYRTAPYAALFLRVSLSFLFFAHLYWKFAIKGYDAWWAGMIEAGYPNWASDYTLFIEFTGAVLLLFGVYTRYVCLLALPVMIAIINHWAVRKGFWFTAGGAELPVAWSTMLVTQILLGDGAFALRVPALPWERGTVAAKA
jgi:putative oxidoreductase